ncbi:MAG: beta-N-acetylhexosaminidase [Limnohabitans sp.]|jgi:beta-N-acetylhexosaminidase
MNIQAPLIIDIEGFALTAVDKKRLQNPLTGGIILFGRNWQSRAQLTALCTEIKAIRKDLLICVDHEGGRVQRFRTDGFTHLPAMRRLGQMWAQDGKGLEGEGVLQACKAASAVGYLLASELRACGVDFSFTPVLDLDYGESGVIGDRSFHRDPRHVSLLAKNLMHGLLRAGMGNCGKHFPGHGFIKADSHVDMPIDQRSLKAILKEDAKPYEWLNNELKAVMPAHVIYPKVDARPAGFSQTWIQDVLRERLEFTGAIVSDDLSMVGARVLDGQSIGFTQGVLAALNAGCDLALLCNQSLNNSKVIDEVLDGLAEAQVKGWWQPDELSEARRLALLPTTPALAWDDLVRSVNYQQALACLP